MKQASNKRLTAAAEELIKDRALRGLHHEAYGAYLLWREIVSASVEVGNDDTVRLYRLCQSGKKSRRNLDWNGSEMEWILRE